MIRNKVGRPKGKEKDKFRKTNTTRKGIKSGLHRALKASGLERVSVKQTPEGNYRVIIRTSINKKQVLDILRAAYSEFGIDNVSQYVLPPKE